MSGTNRDTASGQALATPEGRAETVLAVKGVTAGYGEATVLRDVSMSVGSGEIVALLGPNGAGKTTLLRAICGLLTVKVGQVSVDGVDVTGTAPHRRSQNGVCLVPEGRGIFRSLTVLENLRMYSRLAGMAPDDAVDRAVEVFPALKTRMRDAAGHLSGGQQQMLALTRAYVTNPRVILLDEVSMGLAPQIVDEVFEALNVLAATGVAMVIVEQYVSRALAMASHVVLLSKGSVRVAGPRAEFNEAEIVESYFG